MDAKEVEYYLEKNVPQNTLQQDCGGMCLQSNF
jgi:hypothetical protein